MESLRKQQVELGVQRVAQKSFVTTLPDLSWAARRRRPASSASFGAPSASWLRNSSASLRLEADGGLIVHRLVGADQAQALAKLLCGQALHADQQAALVVRTNRPLVDAGVYGFPAAEIEVADAEIRAFGDEQGLFEGREQGRVNVVEDAGHSETAWR